MHSENLFFDVNSPFNVITLFPLSSIFPSAVLSAVNIKDQFSLPTSQPGLCLKISNEQGIGSGREFFIIICNAPGQDRQTERRHSPVLFVLCVLDETPCYCKKSRRCVQYLVHAVTRMTNIKLCWEGMYLGHGAFSPEIRSNFSLKESLPRMMFMTSIGSVDTSITFNMTRMGMALKPLGSQPHGALLFSFLRLGRTIKYDPSFIKCEVRM
ncbi:hypothetical protein BX666DRAFT_2003822 [Dichotomocladium elegans]|nr:hypothetical protein BX666DRAFT_2003822 [Dichotomocladium elegans]